MRAAVQQSVPVFRVFLSHAKGDEASAERVARLVAAGGRVKVFSKSMLSRGEGRLERTRRELEACDVFMVIGSPRAATSDWVLQELGGAWALDKPLVVVSPVAGWTWQLPVETRSVEHISLADLEQPGFIESVLADLIQPADPSPA
jgi:TIR domain